MKVPDAHFAQLLLQPGAIHECVRRTTHPPPEPDVAECIHTRIRKGLEKTCFARAVDANGDNLRCHRSFLNLQVDGRTASWMSMPRPAGQTSPVGPRLVAE